MTAVDTTGAGDAHSGVFLAGLAADRFLRLCSPLFCIPP
jgi:sugar/nucleoside kinase (ribokinase family)